MEKEIRWLLEEKYRMRISPYAISDILKILRGEPAAYVIGFSNFLSCKIDLSQKPLIPRQETEWWTERAIQDIACAKGRVKCLDMFAGSGCIGVAVAAGVPGAEVDFAENEKKFLRQIKINIAKNGIARGRCRVIHSDIFSRVQGKYDYILANPPYIAALRRARVQKSVLDNEPGSALFGGKDGLSLIRKFLKNAPLHLASGGALYMEFDAPQKRAVERLIRLNGYKKTEFFRDQFGKWRYVKTKI